MLRCSSILAVVVSSIFAVLAQTQETTDAAPQRCTSEDLAPYSASGWPTKLDFGIYWYGPNGTHKKAQPRQQVELTNPRSWLEKPDEYHNSTERWDSLFFDPRRPTVIYIHGWSGTAAWSLRDCKRASTICPEGLCPGGGGHDLAEPWIKKGWNIGFFHWDQFADKECKRDAEQEVWFDKEGLGLEWTSYDPRNDSKQKSRYRGDGNSLVDLCASEISKAFGDFYEGSSIRLVGQSIGTQLAVGCAAKLHNDQYVSAPQRLTLLDPLFTKEEFSFMGTQIRCGKISTETGLQDFAQRTTSNLIKILWTKYLVVTETYESDNEPEGKVSENNIIRVAQDYYVKVTYDPKWCAKAKDEERCRRFAVLPLYFLGMGVGPLPLARNTGDAAQSQNYSMHAKRCLVPSASCPDNEMRALVESHQSQARSIERSRGITSPVVWKQTKGQDTMDVADDEYKLSIEDDFRLFSIDGELEDRVANTNAVRQRSWDLQRAWHLGPHSGISASAFRLFINVIGTLITFPLFAFVAVQVGRVVHERLCSAEPADSEDDSEDSTGDVELGSSSPRRDGNLDRSKLESTDGGSHTESPDSKLRKPLIP